MASHVPRLDTSDAVIGVIFVGAVTRLLVDVVVGFPVEHAVLVLLFGSVLRAAHRRALFNKREALLFAAIVAALFLIVALTFSGAFVVLTSDAILLVHAVMCATRSSAASAAAAAKRRMLVVSGGALLLDLLLAAVLPSFAAPLLLPRVLLCASAALGGAFLACFVLADCTDVASDWVKVQPTAQLQQQLIDDRDNEEQQQGKKQNGLQKQQQQQQQQKELQQPTVDHCKDHEVLDQIGAHGMYLDQPDPVNIQGSAELRMEEDLSLEPDTVPCKQVLLPPLQQEEAEKVAEEEVSAGSPGFLDQFLQHRSEMQWLRAKARLLDGAVFLKRLPSGSGDASGTGRRRLVRLNQSSAMLEWWRIDLSKLVGQARIEDMHQVYFHTHSPPHSSRGHDAVADTEHDVLANVHGDLSEHNGVGSALPTTFLVVFSSRTIELEAPDAVLAKQWVDDLTLLLQHRITVSLHS